MRTNYIWPIMLILAGVLLLLSNLGYMPGNAWDYIWPTFLILLGLSFILRRRGGFETEADSLPLDGASSARLTLKHGAGRLEAHAGSEPSLLYRGTFGGGVEKRVNRAGDQLDVTLQTRVQFWMDWVWPWNWGPSRGLQWELGLNPNVPLALTLESGASESHLDLANVRVTELTIKTGASATKVTLPAQAGHTRVRIESGAASVEVSVPEGVAARIHGVMGLGALDVNQSRFPRRGDSHESPDFASAANKVEMEIQGGVGAVKVW